jgi:hypothetical protein
MGDDNLDLPHVGHCRGRSTNVATAYRVRLAAHSNRLARGVLTADLSLTASRRGDMSQPRLPLVGAAIDGRTCVRTTGSHCYSK